MPKIIVNEFYRGSNLTTGDEFIELLLTEDVTAAQLNSFFVGDSTASKSSKFSAYDFTNAGSIASTFQAGTLITIGGTTAITQNTSYNPAGGDWNIALNASGSFLPNANSGTTGDIAGDDIVWIDSTNTGSTISADGFAVDIGTATGAFTSAANVNFGSSTNSTGYALNSDLAGASNTANWTTGIAFASTTPGQPNGGANTTYITSLRESLPAALSLSVSPGSFSEAAGATAATGTISRTGNATSALTVTLASSDTSEAIVPTTVEIAAGQTTATFAIAAVDDTAVDGDQAVTLTASATSFTNATTNLTVTDDDATSSTVRIHDIQAAAQVSPLVGQRVDRVPGIVTVVRSNGFYLQDPNPDANDATSEGIFVFTSSAPTVSVGDSVLVSGTVSEFRPGGSSGTNNLTTTQIGGNPTITRLSSGNTLPTATILGNSGRAIPNTVIEDDASGNVETSNTFDPAQDGIDFYESLEGMLVQVNNAVAVGPTSDFGEIPVLADNGENAGTRTSRGGIAIQPGDFNPERIFIDDAIVPNEPQVNVGDRFNGAIVGVVDYSFGNFKLLNTAALPAVQSGGLTRESTTLQGTTDQLTVASFNVENLDPSDGTVKFAALADAIVNNLKAPDILSLEEVQDNNGATNDSVVDANVTYQTLIDAIAAAGGPRYEFRQINPVDDQDGGQPGGNIRVGFLFNPSRVDFVDRPSGSSTTNTTVASVAGEPELSASPGRLLDTNPNEADTFPGDDFANSRKPLVGEFLFNGNTVFVIGNHFNSKGGDDPLFGRDQPPELSSERQRLQQAQIVNDFVDRILAIDPNANVVAMGDFNDFQFSRPLQVLRQGNDADTELYNLYEKLPVSEQYSYVFEGNSQALDHILVSNSLNNVAEFDVVHINSEFADQISDHDPLVARLTLTRPNQAPIAQNDAATTIENQAVTINVLANDSDADGTLTSVALATTPSSGTVSIGSNGSVIYTPNADFSGDDSFSYTVQDDDGAASNAATVTVSVLNEIVGTEKSDRLLGTEARDVIRALDGNDRLCGFGGDDLLEAGAGNDWLDGGTGNDTLNGGVGSDRLVGDAGDDLLNGGVGNNQLEGGLGRDRFVLAAGAGRNEISDFTDGQDLLALSGLTFGQLAIAQSSTDTLISANGELLAILQNVQATAIGSADFTSV